MVELKGGSIQLQLNIENYDKEIKTKTTKIEEMDEELSTREKEINKSIEYMLEM